MQEINFILGSLLASIISVILHFHVGAICFTEILMSLSTQLDVLIVPDRILKRSLSFYSNYSAIFDTRILIEGVKEQICL